MITLPVVIRTQKILSVVLLYIKLKICIFIMKMKLHCVLSNDYIAANTQ